MKKKNILNKKIYKNKISHFRKRASNMTSLSSNVTENPNVLPLDGLSIATFKSKEQLSSGKYERSPEWSSQGSWK